MVESSMSETSETSSSGLWAVIALRYLRTGGNRYSQFVAWVSVTGLALGVAALIAVTSVMNGLGGEIQARVLGNVSQVFLTPWSDTVPNDDFARRAKALGLQEGVVAAFDFIEAGGVLSVGGGVHPILVYGAGPEAAPWLPAITGDGDRQGLVVGALLAEYFQVRLEEHLRIVMIGADGRTRALRVPMTGMFETRSDLDYSLVFLPLARFDALRDQSIGRRGVRLLLEEPLRAPQLVDDWRARGLLEGMRVEDWTEAQGDLVRVLGMERVIMFSLLLMIIAIAALNLVSGQAMLVSEKQSEIAILRTMGADAGLIVRAFLAYGGFVALLGTAIGVVLGVVLAIWSGEIMAIIHWLTGVDILAGSLFDRLPVKILALDLLLVAGLSLLVSFIACIAPARRAARLSPADLLA